MKNNIVVFFCLATLAHALAIHQVNAANDLVRQLCQRTTNNNLCLSIIEADPRQDLKNSPNGLCTILRERAVSNAIATSSKISNLLKTTTNRYAVQCLQICADSYQISIMRLRSADFRVISRQGYVSLAGGVAVASDATHDCEGTFTERPGTPPSPLTSENQSLEDVVRLVLEIINLTICNKVASCFAIRSKENKILNKRNNQPEAGGGSVLTLWVLPRSVDSEDATVGCSGLTGKVVSSATFVI
ncbi:hypothetical protein ACJIZ3_014757 [Penstemon smallii]|uniref:Pectinesterase inhibitor domain-containing protein n=1 Tax=Penstemon smallii TaxID=265156 RepID=A0ABD3RKH4_9LAMI